MLRFVGPLLVAGLLWASATLALWPDEKKVPPDNPPKPVAAAVEKSCLGTELPQASEEIECSEGKAPEREGKKEWN